LAVDDESKKMALVAVVPYGGEINIRAGNDNDWQITNNCLGGRRGGGSVFEWTLVMDVGSDFPASVAFVPIG